MPQNGFHGLIGLAAARAMARHLPPQALEAATGGVVLGSMLPDVDMYPTGVAYLFGVDPYLIHRTATHSIFFTLLLLLMGFVFRPGRWLLLGLCAGVCTHLVMDVFFWFAAVDLFWPASRLDLGVPVLNLWTADHLSHLWVNIREAFEYAAFALYLGVLRRSAGVASTTKWETALWAGFLATLTTAFLFRDHESWQHYLVTVPYLLCFLPYVWLQTWRHRCAIATWTLGLPAATEEPGIS